MRDLIRNYKLILRGKTDSDSDSESRPLASSSSTPPDSLQSSAIFLQDSDTDMDTSQMERKFLTRQYTTYGSTRAEAGVPIDVPETKPIFSDFPVPPQTTTSSLVTIFSIWNTTVGTSLLTMAWGIEKTGLFAAIFLNVALGALCFYSANLLLKMNAKHGMPSLHHVEVFVLCRALIGKWAELLAKIFSLVVLIGANIVYWILMSNFLYNTVQVTYDAINDKDHSETENSLLCPRNVTNITLTTTENVTWWGQYTTVPLCLGILMFPILHAKDDAPYKKLNSLGSLCVMTVIVFVGAKALQWGVNMPDWWAELHLKADFWVLIGMLSLSYFIHNIIIALMKNNHRQEHNGRDLSIAFGLVTFTYLFVGVVFYVSFPLPKFCIEDNILNNFHKSDPLAVVVRICLLIQLFTVFPLMLCMLRNDLFAHINAIWQHRRFGDFTYPRVVTLNIIILLMCILFACFLPKIGTLIRYTGAMSGLVFIFLLPSLLKLASLRKDGGLTGAHLILHTTIILIGCINLLFQFLVHE